MRTANVRNKYYSSRLRKFEICNLDRNVENKCMKKQQTIMNNGDVELSLIKES